MNEKLYVVMPAYNEEENIETVVRTWYLVLSGKDADSRLVIADSGSKDQTHEILVNLQKELKQLEILETDDRQHGRKLLRFMIMQLNAVQITFFKQIRMDRLIRRNLNLFGVNVITMQVYLAIEQYEEMAKAGLSWEKWFVFC